MSAIGSGPCEDFNHHYDILLSLSLFRPSLHLTYRIQQRFKMLLYVKMSLLKQLGLYGLLSVGAEMTEARLSNLLNLGR